MPAANFEDVRSQSSTCSHHACTPLPMGTAHANTIRSCRSCSRRPRQHASRQMSVKLQGKEREPKKGLAFQSKRLGSHSRKALSQGALRERQAARLSIDINSDGLLHPGWIRAPWEVMIECFEERPVLGSHNGSWGKRICCSSVCHWSQHEMNGRQVYLSLSHGNIPFQQSDKTLHQRTVDQLDVSVGFPFRIQHYLRLCEALSLWPSCRSPPPKFPTATMKAGFFMPCIT